MKFLFRKPPVAYRDFAAAPGERIYAIGDVHGCIDQLDDLLARIAVDDAARPAASTSVIFLGDLIDRGPASATVVERVIGLAQASDRVKLILGNHEEIFLEAARGKASAAKSLLAIGGYATLASYGITSEEADHGSFEDLAATLLQRIPRSHVDFLARGRQSIRSGDYLFVHAGIRPGRALDAQNVRDLRWIREPFLSAVRNDGMMVVHGHTPTRDVDIREDRIGVDTGAYMSGTLTAIGIEGRERWFLTASGQQANLAAE
ncbi:metallophosphoesterase family protein [Sphingomonas japonica]|uniref:Serine/threonine protein phosphatase 1 n=1 Tax=Sphingomonas japonica TaxID=511662 RepID=A0ABX0U4Y8_9SPHN|nr:metallophosphoesterase family protein [Sphingomonas japonica]NIJ25120.1 serine/threonine protein phosphatase 1 [Sphingomonas japonica]